jgi:hypothetical protein
LVHNANLPIFAQDLTKNEGKKAESKQARSHFRTKDGQESGIY